MLDFFRRYQRYFYIVITIVIVISFSFFGTYNAMSDGSFREQIAFTAIDGTDVTRHELDEMVVFLGTDIDDKILFGGMWGPNFLNDGVIKKDFIQTGLAALIVDAYLQDLQSDLMMRFEKEKHFNLYVHPQARFIGTESAWTYFAPGMRENFNIMRMAANPLDPDALQARFRLFLMERQFPAPLLRQVLRYQEKQNQWVVPDSTLDHTDLSLFGYHTLEDWFGPGFVRLVSEFIMNAAIVAEQKGYEVSKADALASLMHNAEISYRQNAQNPHLGVTNANEYFNEQLRRMGMDRNTAVKVWKQVLLTRRMFQDMGSSVFVDPQTFAPFAAYAQTSVEGDRYHLPKDFHLNSYRAMQKLDIYLDAISKRTDKEKSSLMMPTALLSPEQVAKQTPELTQKRYLLDVAQASKKTLEANIGVKETWNWETSDSGWTILQKEFPDLGTKTAETKEARFAALEKLDDATRARVDQFSRAEIVREHPEWLEKALAEAPTTRKTIGLHEKGSNATFVGLKDSKALMKLLDAYPLSGAADSPSAKDAVSSLSHYSADQSTYYRIAVIDRSPELEVLTFKEADQQGVLDQLLDSKLEDYYKKNRDSLGKEFQRDDKSWKSFAEVKDSIADRYFASTLQSIRSSYAASENLAKGSPELIKEVVVTLRLYPYVQHVRGQLQKNSAEASQWISSNEDKPEAPAADKLPPKSVIADQWKLEKEAYQATRGSADEKINTQEALALSEGGWTQVKTPVSGDLSFFHLMKKGELETGKVLETSVSTVHTLLSDGAQQRLMLHLLKQIESKGAMSLDYLHPINSDDNSESA